MRDEMHVVRRMEKDYGYRFGEKPWRYSEAAYNSKDDLRQVVVNREDVPQNSLLYLQGDPAGRPKEWAKALWPESTPHVTIDVPDQPRE